MNIEWFIEDQVFLPSYDLAPPPFPSPLSRQQVVSFNTSCVSQVGRAFWREGGGGVVKSYDNEKAWSSINYSILSGVQHVRSCEYCFEDCTHLAFLFWMPNLANDCIILQGRFYLEFFFT